MVIASHISSENVGKICLKRTIETEGASIDSVESFSAMQVGVWRFGIVAKVCAGEREARPQAVS